MPEELHAESYKLTVEKSIALVLGGVSLWFCFGGVSQGYGVFGDFFGAIKLGVCVLSIFLCLRVFPIGVLGPAILCAGIALIYNPFFKLDLDHDSWRAVNLATAVAYAWIVWRFHKVTKLMTPEYIEKIRQEEAREALTQARADAIDGAIERGEFDERRINEFMGKLSGAGSSQNSQPSSPVSKENLVTNGPDKGKVIYFVMKGPPPGVPRTSQNTIATAAVKRIIEPDGTYKTTTTLYAGSDPLTIIEAYAATYWRSQIENGVLTDRQAFDGLRAIQQHTSHNYINHENVDAYPDEIAITSGLARLSLHYAIAYLGQINVHHPTVRWMAEQQVKGISLERASDYKKAESLKGALAHAEVTTEFLTYLKASVAGSKKEADQPPLVHRPGNRCAYGTQHAIPESHASNCESPNDRSRSIRLPSNIAAAKHTRTPCGQKVPGAIAGCGWRQQC